MSEQATSRTLWEVFLLGAAAGVSVLASTSTIASGFGTLLGAEIPANTVASTVVMIVLSTLPLIFCVITVRIAMRGLAESIYVPSGQGEKEEA